MPMSSHGKLVRERERECVFFFIITGEKFQLRQEVRYNAIEFRGLFGGYFHNKFSKWLENISAFLSKTLTKISGILILIH